MLFTIEKTITAAMACHAFPREESHNIAQQIDAAAASSNKLSVPGIFRRSSFAG